MSEAADKLPTVIDVWLHEYDNLWNEKILHKVSIRKFEAYSAYMTAIGSLVLAFYGINPSGLLTKGLTGDSQTIIANGRDIIGIFCIIFPIVIMIVMTFPQNDMFHTYAIGSHVAFVENSINIEINRQALSWESIMSPRIYGGAEFTSGKSITNLIRFNNNFILIPALSSVGLVSLGIAVAYINFHLACYWLIIYLFVVLWTLVSFGWGWLKLYKYTKPDSDFEVMRGTVHLGGVLKQQ